MAQEQLFASFLLDKSQDLEIALRADSVTEATPITGMIRQLPASMDFVDGIMTLRGEAIPIINLKKRLGLAGEHYDHGTMVAVVNLFHRRYGLLFEDIREVFAADRAEIQKVDPALQTDDKIISALIQVKKSGKTVELLDLNSLFHKNSLELEKIEKTLDAEKIVTKETRYLRYVVFQFARQLFGVPVECTQEITFFDEVTCISRDSAAKAQTAGSLLEEMFKHGDIDGTLSLRGRTIPVLSAGRILAGAGVSGEEPYGEKTRVLVLAKDSCTVGLIVEEITSIEAIPEDQILPLGLHGDSGVSGIYQKTAGRNIMLLNMDSLVCNHIDELKAMTRLAVGSEKAILGSGAAANGAHHILTENCYLVFRIGPNIAVQLKDVQEIIEKEGVLGVPGGSGFASGVINLRGSIVPVLNLREFFGYQSGRPEAAEQKLVICRSESRIVALEVDGIVTIYKQEQYHNTTSLKPDLAKKEDVLDRLIVFDGGAGQKEHVLVVNIHNLIRNHLDAAAI